MAARWRKLTKEEKDLLDHYCSGISQKEGSLLGGGQTTVGMQKKAGPKDTQRKCHRILPLFATEGSEAE